MLINKFSDINANTDKRTAASKTAVSKAENAAAGKNNSAASAKTSIISARSVSSLLASSGLPSDKLSASIVSLARFFSLSFKPQQLASIRQAVMQTLQAPQQTNAQQANMQPASNSEAAITPRFFAEGKHAQAPDNKPVLALAASAAESKGIELSPKGLEMFADAVDPDRRQNSGEREQKRSRDEKQNEEKASVVFDAAALKKTALDTAESNPLLSAMNRLPGKNGQRWIVLPFEFHDNGKDFRVSMRVLLEKETASLMALDVSCNDSRNSFMLQFADNKISKLMFFGQNEIQSSKPIRKELSALFEIPIERVIFKTANVLCEEMYGQELLRFFDEAV